jgi:hypothetical protein
VFDKLATIYNSHFDVFDRPTTNYNSHFDVSNKPIAIYSSHFEALHSHLHLSKPLDVLPTCLLYWECT